MGCDIHLYVEVREQDRWLFDENIRLVRNYFLFLFLNPHSVSHRWNNKKEVEEIKPLSSNRGLPPDLSSKVQREVQRWEADGHSHSWFSLSEFLTFQHFKQVLDGEEVDFLTYMRSEERYGYRVQWSWHEFYDYLLKLNVIYKPEDVRVIFWFDN